MEISSINKVVYRPSEKAKEKLRKIKEEYPKRSLASIVDEAVIKLKLTV